MKRNIFVPTLFGFSEICCFASLRLLLPCPLNRVKQFLRWYVRKRNYPWFPLETVNPSPRVTGKTDVKDNQPIIDVVNSLSHKKDWYRRIVRRDEMSLVSVLNKLEFWVLLQGRLWMFLSLLL